MAITRKLGGNYESHCRVRMIGSVNVGPDVGMLHKAKSQLNLPKLNHKRSVQIKNDCGKTDSLPQQSTLYGQEKLNFGTNTLISRTFRAKW